MTQAPHKTALIVGAGQGLSASLARLFARAGMHVGLASRDVSKLKSLCDETGAVAFDCDVADARQVDRLFQRVDERLSPLDVVVFNPGARVRGPFIDLRRDDVERALSITAMGGFLVAQAVPLASSLTPGAKSSAAFSGWPRRAAASFRFNES